MGTPSEPSPDDFWKPPTPGAAPTPPPEYLCGTGEYIPEFDYPDQPVRPTPPVPKYHPYPEQAAAAPPEGRGLVVTAFVFAGLALLVPCLFGWAGIFLGLAAGQKGNPQGKVAVWTSVGTMFIGFALAALARKYWLT